MRFSLSVLALAAVSVAQENPFEEYQAKFQSFIGNMASKVPNPMKHDPVAAAEARLGSMKLHTLTLDNWKNTLYGSVAPGQLDPTEWWVLISGGNKTCMGRCDKLDAAFNETAGKFAVTPSSPQMGYINCDDQPVLCNSWSANAGSLWVVDMLPSPSPVDIYTRRFNLTSVASSDLVALKGSAKLSSMTLLESRFHPFNGQFAQLGLAVPFGWGLWAFALVPNWLFMLLVSMFSRTMMSNRMQQQGTNRPPQQ